MALVEVLIAEGTRTGGQVPVPTCKSPRTHVKPGGHASVYKVESNWGRDQPVASIWIHTLSHTHEHDEYTYAHTSYAHTNAKKDHEGMKIPPEKSKLTNTFSTTAGCKITYKHQ